MNLHQKHTVWQSVILHILPGLLAVIVYYFCSKQVVALGYPSVMALIIAGLIVLIPFEFGVILIAKRNSGEKLIGDIIKNFSSIKLWKFFLWIVVVFLVTGLLFSVTSGLADEIKDLFKFLPSEFFLNMGLDGNYATNKLIITYVLFFVLIVLVIPILEEVYFRGFLMPRMPAKFNGFIVPLHSFFFALYHFWTPWMIISRTIGVMPLIFAVKRTKNIYIGIVVHCLLNTIDLVVAINFLIN
jgi:membrane protease YdiL (CAAX protease family)